MSHSWPLSGERVCVGPPAVTLGTETPQSPHQLSNWVISHSFMPGSPQRSLSEKLGLAQLGRGPGAGGVGPESCSQGLVKTGLELGVLSSAESSRPLHPHTTLSSSAPCKASSREHRPAAAGPSLGSGLFPLQGAEPAGSLPWVALGHPDTISLFLTWEPLTVSGWGCF